MLPCLSSTKESFELLQRSWLLFFTLSYKNCHNHEIIDDEIHFLIVGSINIVNG